MKNKRLYFLIILLLIMFLGIGYALLTNQLQINGASTIVTNNWDVYFDNIVVSEGSVEPSVEPTITDRTSVSFEVLLDKPRDYYEFTIDVVNAGSIDAKISLLNKTELTSEQAKYLDYSVTYSNGVELRENDLLNYGMRKTLLIRISYKDVNKEDLPSDNKEIPVEVSITYVQDGEDEEEGMTLTDEDDDGEADVGEIITIGTEDFYVISNDGTNIRALAKWNLLVANEYTGSASVAISNPTGIQDSTARGLHFASGTSTREYPFIGVTKFAGSVYWETGTIGLSSSKNKIYPFLTNYKSYLEEQGVTVDEVTLVKRAELVELGCSTSSRNCTSAPDWVYQTSYWTRSTYDSVGIWVVTADGVFTNCDWDYQKTLGVRPIISVLVSELEIN